MSFYKLSKNEKIILPEKANNPAVLDTLHNYIYTLTPNLEFSDTETRFIIGEPTPCDLEGKDYAINVTENGIESPGDIQRL